jgi:hypothetical protein
MADVETKVVEAGGTTWFAIRARGAEWSWLLPEEVEKLDWRVPTVGCRSPKPCGAGSNPAAFATSPEAAPAPKTFETVRDGDDVILCTRDARGTLVGIATFLNEEACRLFNEALAQNWKAAHAMGHLGF